MGIRINDIEEEQKALQERWGKICKQINEIPEFGDPDLTAQEIDKYHELNDKLDLLNKIEIFLRAILEKEIALNERIFEIVKDEKGSRPKREMPGG